MPPNTVLPLPSSAAGQGPTQGLLLLFKLKTDVAPEPAARAEVLDRGGGQTGTYDLDV